MKNAKERMKKRKPNEQTNTTDRGNKTACTLCVKIFWIVAKSKNTYE